MTYQPAKLGLVQFIHRDDEGDIDYCGVLTVEFGQEEGQWVGLCQELGSAAHTDTLAQVEAELSEAINLQLNEMERLTDIREYLAENQVNVQPIAMAQRPGFALAGNLLTK